MLHILLLILKIIGITVGVLLGVLLLCIAFVLFVPVRYKVEARREQEDAMPVEVKAKVTWLLHLLNIRLVYSGGIRLRARIFLFTVFRLPKKQKADTSSHKEERKKRADTAPHAKRREPEETVEAALDKDNKESKEPETAVLPEPEGHGENRKKADVSGKEEENKKKTEFSLKRLFRKIYRFFQNIWYTIIRICDRIKKIWENIEYYLDVLQGETFKQSFSLCKKELASIFAYLKPRKLQADLVIGMGDPAATAKILAYYGMMYPLIGDHVTIVPDFDTKRIEGTVLVQGKIKLFTLLKAAVRIYFSKDIKRLFKLLKKEDI